MKRKTAVAIDRFLLLLAVGALCYIVPHLIELLLAPPLIGCK